MRIALGQLASGEDKEANLSNIGDFVEKAAAAGASMLVLPEYAMFNHAPMDESFVRAAEPLDGPFCTSVREMAARWELIVAFGALEVSSTPNRAYNTIVVVGADGRDLLHYRKVNLYDAFGGTESKFLSRGEDLAPAVFDVDGAVVGIITCYDIRFPEMAWRIAEAGAQILLVPSSWTPGVRKEDHWAALNRARAIENVVYVAAPCQAPPISTGGSLLIDPMGAVLADGGETETLIVRDLDIERVARVRERIPVHTTRRFRALPNG